MLYHFSPATSTVRVMVVKVYYFCEPPFCFRRRGVVFLFSRTFFLKKYAINSRIIPFRTSRRISRNVSMIITSFPKKEKKINNQPPSQYSVAPLYYHLCLSNNLSIFDKYRGVTGNGIKVSTARTVPMVSIELYGKRETSYSIVYLLKLCSL